MNRNTPEESSAAKSTETSVPGIASPQNLPTFALRPASAEEAGLFYALPPKKDAELGAVGHVRMDFGQSGTEFWHTWWPRGDEALNSPAFKDELGRLVDELRERGPLKSLAAMRNYCGAHGGELGEGSQNYGYIAETAAYRYCLRCNPAQGDYNAYLTAFDLRVQELNRKNQSDTGMTMGGR